MILKILISVALYGTILVANAQSKILLEACNLIDERTKRMECFSEVMRLPAEKLSESGANGIKLAAVKRTKAAFAAIASTVRFGISYSNYSVAILEPAKEVGVLRQEVPEINAIAFDKLEQSATAYNDAAAVWRASIFQSQDAGIFGKILAPERTGLIQIVNRYRLTTTTVLLNTHLPADEALIKIWRVAEEFWKQAFEILDGLPQTIAEPQVGIVTCDKWGNPKDINGNPCVQD